MAHHNYTGQKWTCDPAIVGYHTTHPFSEARGTMTENIKAGVLSRMSNGYVSFQDIGPDTLGYKNDAIVMACQELVREGHVVREGQGLRMVREQH